MRKNNTKIFMGLLFLDFFYDVYHQATHMDLFRPKSAAFNKLNHRFKPFIYI